MGIIMRKNNFPLKAPKHIAIFGGTFSPIHNAHIDVAIFLQDYFKFDQFIFLPNKAPTLDKTTEMSLADRLAMLELALAPYPRFTIDLRETHRSTPSYTVDTLMSFREEWGNEVAMSFIIGMDNFKQFERWQDWEKILTLCNLIVISRPSEKEFPASICIPEITDPHLLSTDTRGGFYRCNAGTYTTSSTLVRNLIRSGEDASTHLPPSVLNYIVQKKLFNG